jgi:hypothetical protein
MTPQQVLLAAADLIEQNGWARHTAARMIRGKEHYCAIGAIVAVTPKAASVDAACDLLLTVIHEPLHSISYWNDWVAMDKRTVVRAMRRAARA